MNFHTAQQTVVTAMGRITSSAVYEATGRGHFCGLVMPNIYLSIRVSPLKTTIAISIRDAGDANETIIAASIDDAAELILEADRYLTALAAKLTVLSYTQKNTLKFVKQVA